MKKGDKRATSAEIEQRITAILPYYLSGKSVPEICRIMSENPDFKWEVGERQVYRYIDDTKEYLEKISDINKKQEIGKMRIRFEELFKMAIKNKDVNQARLVLVSMCDLFGLNAPSKMESDTILEVIIRRV